MLGMPSVLQVASSAAWSAGSGRRGGVAGPGGSPLQREEAVSVESGTRRPHMTPSTTRRDSGKRGHLGERDLERAQQLAHLRGRREVRRRRFHHNALVGHGLLPRRSSGRVLRRKTRKIKQRVARKVHQLAVRLVLVRLVEQRLDRGHALEELVARTLEPVWKSNLRCLLDGVATPVPHRSTEPARPRG